MDDLNATLGAILGDPQKMEQLRAVAQSLGLNPDASPASGAPPPAAPPASPPASGGGMDPAAFASLLQSLGNAGGNGTAASPPATAGGNGGGMPDLGAISKIAGLMGTFNQSDKNVELLRSLRPHFSPTRAGRIDDAVRIMQLLRMWPSLRDSGLLGSLGSLGNLFGGGGQNR